MVKIAWVIIIFIVCFTNADFCDADFCDTCISPWKVISWQSMLRNGRNWCAVKGERHSTVNYCHSSCHRCCEVSTRKTGSTSALKCQQLFNLFQLSRKLDTISTPAKIIVSFMPWTGGQPPARNSIVAPHFTDLEAIVKEPTCLSVLIALSASIAKRTISLYETLKWVNKAGRGR